MIKKTYNNVNPPKLHQELINAGINPWPVENNGTTEGNPGTEITIYLPDDTPQLVIDQIAAIVAAHDPTPSLPSLQSINITADKTEIMADGIDTATITITLEPAGTGITTVDVLVDGPPVTEVDVIDNVATFEFTAIDPGNYMIEAVSGNIRKYIFVKAV